MGKTHQYPDGMVLMTGTLFAPTEPRKPGGAGFTHMVGDLVSIRSPKLGTLTNRVNHCDKIRALDVRGVGVDAQSGGARAAGMTDDLCRLPASVLREQIAAKKVSPVELTDAVLARAEKLQPVLNCFITLVGDQARAAARQAEDAVMQGKHARTAAWHSFRRQGSREHRGRAHDLRLAAPRRERAPRKTPFAPRA